MKTAKNKNTRPKANEKHTFTKSYEVWSLSAVLCFFLSTKRCFFPAHRPVGQYFDNPKGSTNLEPATDYESSRQLVSTISMHNLDHVLDVLWFK